MKTLLNVKKTTRCAICKYWYDPTNSVLSPKQATVGIWEITDTSMKRKCLKNNLEYPANHFGCRHYECKL